MIAHAAQNQPRVPFQPSSTEPVQTLTIPIGRSRATTSIGQTQPSASTSSCSRRRGRPGWTRYQWPRSMASVMAPRKAAPASVRSRATTWFPPASSAPATSPTRPIDDRHQVEHGRELRAPLVDDGGRHRRAPVDAGHRRDTRRAAVVLGLLPGHPGLAAHHRHDESDQARHGHSERSDLADGHRPERDPGQERPERHQHVRAAQQPAVAEADLASAGREPAERHPADRPLQQHGGGVERDHARRGYRRRPPLPRTTSVDLP